jgi:5-methyltetrahydropteroyltriglutamate--homocysteine methyltransferase
LNAPPEAEFHCGDSKNQHLKYINVFNQALRKKPDDMAICTHLCKGNYKSSWAASGSYDYVAEALFNELNVDGFFMEWDDERSGNFEALRFVPKGKTVVLGLVTTKHAKLESKDLIKRRLEEASQFLDLDQICLSPQCGFSSTCDGNAVTLDDQIAKLKLVVDVAEEVWG